MRRRVEAPHDRGAVPRADERLVAAHEAAVGRHVAGSGDLVEGALVAVVGIDTDRQPVAADRDRRTRAVRVVEPSRPQAVERLRLGMGQEAQQVVERVVLEHEHDDVLDAPTTTHRRAADHPRR